MCAAITISIDINPEGSPKQRPELRVHCLSPVIVVNKLKYMNWPTGVVNNKSNKNTAVEMERDSDRQTERE